MKTTEGLFQKALSDFDRAGGLLYGPLDFAKYRLEAGFPDARTAESISINSFEEGFPKELKNGNAMVLRLGSDPLQQGNTTQFVLSRVRTDWRDYFLFDSDIVKLTERKLFIPDVSERALFPFRLLPKMVESSFVNLGLASGLVQEFLGIQDKRSIVPATGQSTFTFDFLVFSDSAFGVKHNNGQVEIDALITGRRDGIETLFVIEAKHTRHVREYSESTLPKHKLIYPLCAIASRSDIRNNFNLVPLYLRTWYSEVGLNFLLAECSYSFQPVPVLTSLEIARAGHFIIRGF